MSYNSLVSVDIPESLVLAVKYASAIDNFNCHATDTMEHLFHISKGASSAHIEFADAFNRLRDAAQTDEIGLLIEAKTAVYTLATCHGMSHDELMDFKIWINEFEDNARILRQAKNALNASRMS